MVKNLKKTKWIELELDEKTNRWTKIKEIEHREKYDTVAINKLQILELIGLAEYLRERAIKMEDQLKKLVEYA